MANYFEQFEPDEPDDEQQEPDEPRTEEGGGNFFAQFDQRQAPPPRAGEGNFFAQFHQQQDQPEPEAEGMLATFARKARDAVLPVIGGLSAGAIGSGIGRVVGGALGFPLGGPAGAFAGAGLGGFAGGWLGGKAYSEGKKAFGYDDDIQQAVDAKTNPISALAGEFAPLALGLTPTTAAPRIGAKFLEFPIGQRLLSGTISGGIEGATQAAQGEFDPTRLGASFAAGAALPGNRSWVSGLEQRGEALAGRIAPHGTPGAKAAAGTAEEQAPPPTDPARQQPGADERYAKEPAAQTPGEQAVAPTTPPEAPRVSDPTLDAALQAKLKPEAPEAPEAPIAPEPAPESSVEEPTEYGRKLDAEFPRIPNAEAQARPLRGEPPPEPETQTAAAERPDEAVRGPMAREVAPQHMPWYDRGYAGGERGGNEAEQAAWDRGALDRSNAARAAATPLAGEGAPAKTGPASGEDPNAARSALDAIKQAMQQPDHPEPAPQPPAKFSIAKDTDTGRHVLFRNDEEVGDFANRGAAEKARTKAIRLERIREAAARANQIAEEPDQAIRRQEIVRGRSGRPIETAPLPIGTEQAILERGAAKVAAGRTPDEPVPPLRQAQVRQGPEEGGQPPKPPTVGEAAAAAGGTPPPGPTSMAYVPPQKRSNLSNLWRSMKLLVGSDIGPHGREAEHIIRGSEGKAKRVFEQTINLLNPHQEMVLPMNAADRAAMMNRIEGGDHFPDWKPTPEQQRLIDDHKPAMDLWKTEFSKLDRTAQMKFVDDYAAHMYKNPAQAAEFFNNFGRGRGGAGSTKKRTYATYEDAKAAGLEPLTDNPVEIATRYGLSMTNFIAANDALERGVETGVIGYFRPGKSVGATGSPEPQQIGGPPPGWKKLDAPSKGQGPFHLDAYAPEDFADKYNTFYSRGLRGAHAPIYDALRNSNAAWTQMELGLNAYHFFTMANEAIISDVAKGLNQIFSGQFKEGALSIAKAPLAPRISYIEGKRFQQEYLNPNSTNPIASIMAEANARPIGRGHAYDILGSAGDENISRGSFIKNMSRDKINSELKQAWDDIKQDWGLADTVGKQVLFPFKQASRALQTIGAPLFDKYIPALKAGAVHSQMEAWLQANPRIDINTPDGRRAAVEAAKKITDSTDNRFGEMVHDNLFMNQTLRQSAMVAMRSFSWTVGAMREIAGGTYAAGKAGALSLKNQENRFSMAHPEFDPRISYAIAFPFVMATISAIYQGLRAGEAPQDWRDLYAPRTGGTIPGLGGKGQVKEHALMPGFQKDVYGWLTHPLREGYAKLGGLTTTAIEQITNEDWRGDPITKRGANPLEQMQQRAAHLFSRFGPIGVRSMMKGQPETSGITPVETALGFRAPGVDIQDPVRLENWMKKKTEKEWKAKQQHEKTEQRKYGRERVYDPREREQVPQ